MAPEASWDTAAPPPRKKSLSTFGKVAIGCGGAFLCFLLAIGAGAWLVFSKVTKTLDQEWMEIHADIRCLSTDQGARKLYRKKPGLAQNYATEDDFAMAAAEWRPKLGDLPEKRPELKAIFKAKGSGAFTLRTWEADGKKSLTVRLRMSNGSMLSVELENGTLTDIQVD